MKMDKDLFLKAVDIVNANTTWFIPGDKTHVKNMSEKIKKTYKMLWGIYYADK